MRSMTSRVFRGKWNRAGGGDAFAFADVLRALLGVVGGRERIVGRRLLALGVFEVTLQVGDAPPAAGSRSAAFADLAGAPRPVDANVIHDLPLRDVKAVADGVVE